MAIDVAFAESVRQGGQPILRFYRWWPPCISLGRNQMARDQYDTDEARRRGIDFVRRPTGGRAVFHHHEVTYSVVVGDRALGGPRRTYYMIHRALQAGLRLLGVPAELAGHASPALRPSTVPCFQGPDGGAIMVADRKLVGSAQLRERGVILQHGSILLAGDQAHARELLKVRRDRDVTPPPAALKELLPTIPRWQELVDTLALGFERVLGVRLSDATLDRAEMQRAVEAVGQFEDPEWTWRR
jgi:lipoate-protein ligase A